MDADQFSKEEKLLIGSYGTMEYSIESAAMFNPSIVEDFDQSFLAKGEKRVILSFRATVNGHLSSIVFHRGILDATNDFHPNKVRNYIDLPDHFEFHQLKSAVGKVLTYAVSDYSSFYATLEMEELMHALKG